jgi:hypothetical protein
MKSTREILIVEIDISKLQVLTLLFLHNSTSFHDGESDSFPALGDVRLVENKWTIF